MPQDDERLKALEARCTSFASEFLHQLREHPKFAELVDRLERIEGPIYRGDVEDALSEVTVPPPRNKSKHRIRR